MTCKPPRPTSKGGMIIAYFNGLIILADYVMSVMIWDPTMDSETDYISINIFRATENAFPRFENAGTIVQCVNVRVQFFYPRFDWGKRSGPTIQRQTTAYIVQGQVFSYADNIYEWKAIG